MLWQLSPQELITIPVKSMKNSSKSSENILVCMFKNKVLSEPIRLIIPQEEYDVSVITFLDHPGLTRTFLVCLCLSFPCTHKTEYSELSLWNMMAGGCSSELSPAKKLQIQPGNLVPLGERGRVTWHPPKSLFTSQHSHPQPTPNQHPSEAESCLYSYSYPSLFLKPCAPHQANRGERAGASDSSTGANVMSFSQAFAGTYPQEDVTTLLHCDTWSLQNPCSHELM